MVNYRTVLRNCNNNNNNNNYGDDDGDGKYINKTNTHSISLKGFDLRQTAHR